MNAQAFPLRAHISLGSVAALAAIGAKEGRQ
jgi:hypothetical protein